MAGTPVAHAGIAVTAGTAEEAEGRRVAGMIKFADRVESLQKSSMAQLVSLR